MKNYIYLFFLLLIIKEEEEDGDAADGKRQEVGEGGWK